MDELVAGQSLCTMSAELKKYRFDYKPGRTPEQLEHERFDESMKRTHTERFRIMMQLIRISGKNKQQADEKRLDNYDENIIAFLQSLVHFKVRYIIVGDFAANFFGYSRLTYLFEIWIQDTLVNRRNLSQALDSLSIVPAELVERMQFIPGWTNLSLNNGFPIDIMTQLKGLESYSFEECLQIAIKPEIEGVIVPFLHINHLIAAKKAANRPKDQLDIIELEKIKDYLEKQEG